MHCFLEGSQLEISSWGKIAAFSTSLGKRKRHGGRMGMAKYQNVLCRNRARP
jgi:hypothetical protein